MGIYGTLGQGNEHVKFAGKGMESFLQKESCLWTIPTDDAPLLQKGKV